MNKLIGATANYDTFSEDSANEIASDLKSTNYGGDTCMAEFNGTTVLPHSDYVCDSEGHCYRRNHSHNDGAALFVILLLVYFFIVWCLILWPYEYFYTYEAVPLEEL